MSNTLDHTNLPKALLMFTRAISKLYKDFYNVLFYMYNVYHLSIIYCKLVNYILIAIDHTHAWVPSTTVIKLISILFQALNTETTQSSQTWNKNYNRDYMIHNEVFIFNYLFISSSVSVLTVLVSSKKTYHSNIQLHVVIMKNIFHTTVQVNDNQSYTSFKDRLLVIRYGMHATHGWLQWDHTFFQSVARIHAIHVIYDTHVDCDVHVQIEPNSCCNKIILLKLFCKIMWGIDPQPRSFVIMTGKQ